MAPVLITIRPTTTQPHEVPRDSMSKRRGASGSSATTLRADGAGCGNSIDCDAVCVGAGCVTLCECVTGGCCTGACVGTGVVACCCATGGGAAGVSVCGGEVKSGFSNGSASLTGL